MHAYHPERIGGRLAELSPFEIEVETPNAAACEATAVWRGVSISTEELYGCVDWYQYPGQTEENKKAAAKH